MTAEFRIRVVPSMREVKAQDWNGLLGSADPNPFLLHEFFLAAEESGSAVPRTGWQAQHMLLEDEAGSLLGALPCYWKSHSQGEYVFDHGWADALERAGGRYYPKLQCAVPFTPATGQRLLAAQGKNREAIQAGLLEGLKQLTERHGASSGHITFMPEDEWNLAAGAGYLQRTDQQFHWLNAGYRDFADFLDSLSSRKRKNIRKERETATAGNGITIERLSGSDLNEEIWDRFHEFYLDTGSRKWGRPYLTRSFFSMIGETIADRIVLVMARRNGQYVAGAINFLGDDCLFGRHWGCVEDHPCLHFEICYYQAIEDAIERKLARVEAGAQGAHKLARGYVPVTTRSAHWIAHPGLRQAVADYLEHERRHVEMEAEALAAHAPYRKSD